MVFATFDSQSPADLDRLDAALLAVRQWVKRPGHRRRFWDRMTVPIDLATIRVLRAVEHTVGGDPTVGDIATQLGVDPSTASRFIERVVDRGELERHTCNQDRRRTRLRITPRGQGTLSAVTQARRDVLAEVTDGWDPRDVKVLADLLERLGERFDNLESS